MALNLGAKVGHPVPMNGADVTAHDVAVTLFKAKTGEPVDLVALRIMTAVRDGETDTERLKELALRAFGRIY